MFDHLQFLVLRNPVLGCTSMWDDEFEALPEDVHREYPLSKLATLHIIPVGTCYLWEGSLYFESSFDEPLVM